ncbi:hypothetical protein PHMEG_00018191 [Phytophthora megakarya]|uniref:Reverse transcriptase RNase H-like domain-containing protein n=1 Tax=Phytophthora megakarya TaxID=4795 RepID=A0A225VUP6_9STRA|nr:hypothetical protein PHMEG_00018191 [Phytophthora megakarya]
MKVRVLTNRLTGFSHGLVAHSQELKSTGVYLIYECGRVGFAFCDHRSLTYVFAPAENVKKHTRGKLLCWAMKLNELRYTINHIAGTDVVWADMLLGGPVNRHQRQFTQVRKLYVPRRLPSWFTERGDGLIIKNDRLWLPTDGSALVRRLLIISHYGSQGHRG